MFLKGLTYGGATISPGEGEYSVWKSGSQHIVTWQEGGVWKDIVVEGDNPLGSIKADVQGMQIVKSWGIPGSIPSYRCCRELRFPRNGQLETSTRAKQTKSWASMPPKICFTYPTISSLAATLRHLWKGLLSLGDGRSVRGELAGQCRMERHHRCR